MNYKIAALAVRPSGSTARLPSPTGTLTAELELRTAIRAVMRGQASYVRETILPTYTRLAAQRRAEMRDVALGDDVAGEIGLRALTAILVATAERTVRRILGLEARRHTASFKATAKRVLSIDLDAVVRDEDLTDVLEAIVSRNAALITNLAGSVEADVARLVSDAYVRGKPASALRKELQKVLDDANGYRSQRIAKDQIGSVASELTAYRHQQAGIAEYDFQDSVDERVRESHAAMRGKRCKYSDPTVYFNGTAWVPRSGIGGVTKHPGQDIMCRCTGSGIVVFG